MRYSTNTRAPEDVALEYMQSNQQVVVEETDWVTFSPADQPVTTGFIFYPGGSVEYPAYAPTLNQIAARGYLVVDVPMPLSLAVFWYQ